MSKERPTSGIEDARLAGRHPLPPSNVYIKGMSSPPTFKGRMTFGRIDRQIAKSSGVVSYVAAEDHDS